MLPSELPSATLHKISLFAGLNAEVRAEVLAQATLRKLKKGEYLFMQGDDVRWFYILLDGTLQVFRETPDGHEKTINLMTTGETPGASEIMDACSTYRAHARAVDDAELLQFSSITLKQIAQQHGAIALHLLSQMAEKAHEAELEAEHQATMSAAQLVACFIQRLCILCDLNPHGFDLPYSKTLIASRLGMELETFSRALNKLRANGISINGNHVVIEDLELINAYVCESCSISRECITHQKMADRIRS